MSKSDVEDRAQGRTETWLHRGMFCLLCLFAAASGLSVAVTNVAMGLLVPLAIYVRQ